MRTKNWVTKTSADLLILKEKIITLSSVLDKGVLFLKKDAFFLRVRYNG